MDLGVVESNRMDIEYNCGSVINECISNVECIRVGDFIFIKNGDFINALRVSTFLMVDSFRDTENSLFESSVNWIKDNIKIYRATK